MTAGQAYINGFVKRASEYGVDKNEAVNLLKESSFGKMLNRLSKSNPRTFKYFNDNLKEHSGFFNEILKDNPELRRGADIGAIARLGKIRFSQSPEDQLKMKAIAELTGKDPGRVISEAMEASYHQDYLKDVKNIVKEKFTPQNSGGFAAHVKAERANNDFENTKNKIMQLFAKKNNP